MRFFCKRIAGIILIAAMVPAIAGCGINPATGERQFAALMSPQQEAAVGAQEHQRIMQQFGGAIKDAALQDYVSMVGQRVARDTERPDVQYTFHVLDTPVVNAFALPGGYVYVTRGLLALANSEAQLASVLAHEIGHITARHSAERYSHGVVTSLGAAVLSAALDSKGAAQALNTGSDLYITSYSRKQESQADELGIRYLDRAGYNPLAMSEFLTGLGRYSAFESQEKGQQIQQASYFSTHPQTETRASEAAAIAASYPAHRAEAGGDYLSRINGMVFGDSAEQGLIRGPVFWHPAMGFTFTVPDGYAIANNPAEVVAKDKASGTVILFDSIRNAQAIDPAVYLSQIWMKGEPVNDLKAIDVNGKRAATASFSGKLNQQAVTVFLAAIEWSPGRIFRFQAAMAPDAPEEILDGLKRTIRSLRPMSAEEQQRIHPYRISLVTAKTGDTVVSLSAGQPYPSLREQRFRALNNMAASDNVVPGHVYKTIVD
jgi:predicted Zn-dependent protease